MRIPVSENLFDDTELMHVDVELERETVHCLRDAADRRDITFDQMLRYLINIGMEQVAVDPDAAFKPSAPDQREACASSDRPASDRSASDEADSAHDTVIDRFRNAKKRLDQLEERRDEIRNSDRQQLYERLMNLQESIETSPDAPTSDQSARDNPPSMFDLVSNENTSEASS